MSYKKFLLAIWLLFFVHCASAYFISGEDLHLWCREYPSTSFIPNNRSCSGFISGVFDTLISVGSPNAQSCFNKKYPGFTLDQLILTVKKYITNHPENLNIPGADLVMLTLSKYYPFGDCLSSQK